MFISTFVVDFFLFVYIVLIVYMLYFLFTL